VASGVIGTKEADLVTAVLLYAMRCLAEGDLHALRAMKFGPKEIEALRELNLADLYRIGSLQAHCLTIQLDREVFWPMLDHLRASRDNEDVKRDLMQADAPLEMMRALFGVSSREYTRLRRMLALAPAVGRPAEPDEETEHKLWLALSSHLTSSPSESLGPQQYLAAHEASGASMRAIWNHVQRWLETGDIEARTERPSTSVEAPAHETVQEDSCA
jgi:hypothetical protein